MTGARYVVHRREFTTGIVRHNAAMRALTVKPGVAGSAAIEDVPEPGAGAGDVVVETLFVGVCGTDIEIASGAYGWAPPGRDRLVLGHESLGRVVEAPAGSGLAPGDLVVLNSSKLKCSRRG